MKYYILAGEASGDLHASNLIRELKLLDSQAEFRAWGGDKMAAQGAEIVKHYKELAFMGFAEVAMNLRTILNNISFCKKDIKEYNPDVVIFVDYPGFNLRLAGFVKGLGIRTVYYISPQVWAWKSGRVETIKKFIDQMLVILPFEKKWYQEKGMDVEYVGHPLLDALENLPEIDQPAFRKSWKIGDKPIVALLPGSRKQEIKKVLPIMLQVRHEFPDYQFVVSGAPGQELFFYESLTRGKVPIVVNQTYDLLRLSSAAVVTSGTATLETALLKVPEVVVYKGSALSYQIAKRLVKHVPYISLVNLIMNCEVVKELIQNDFNRVTLVEQLRQILDKESQQELSHQFNQLEEVLGGAGASKRAAGAIVDKL